MRSRRARRSRARLSALQFSFGSRLRKSPWGESARARAAQRAATRARGQRALLRPSQAPAHPGTRPLGLHTELWREEGGGSVVATFCFPRADSGPGLLRADPAGQGTYGRVPGSRQDPGSHGGPSAPQGHPCSFVQSFSIYSEPLLRAKSPRCAWHAPGTRSRSCGRVPRGQERQGQMAGRQGPRTVQPRPKEGVQARCPRFGTSGLSGCPVEGEGTQGRCCS